MINYLIDGTNLMDLGIGVKETSGLLDVPKMKKPLTVSWNDRHGEQVDLSSVRFETREITLTCYMIATSRLDFLTRVNTLAASLLMTPGLKQLRVEYEASKPLVYMVYFPHGLDIKRATKWNAARHTGEFQLKFREPEPVKKVLKFVASAGNLQVNLSFSSNKQVTVHWGDKTITATNTDNPSISRTYQAAGTYYIVLAGVIEELTNLITNAQIIWERI